MYFSLTSRSLLIFCLCAIGHLSESFGIRSTSDSNPRYRISWTSITSDVKLKSDSAHTRPTSPPLVSLFPPLQPRNQGPRLARTRSAQHSDEKSIATGEQAPYQGLRVKNDAAWLPKSPKPEADLTDTAAENKHGQKVNDKEKREDKNGDSKSNSGDGKGEKAKENGSPIDDVVCSAGNVRKRRSISLDEHLRREFSSYFPGANVSDIIDKRTLPSAPDDKEEYLTWLFRHIRNGGDAHLLPYAEKNGVGLSSHQIHHFLEKPFSVGLDGLKGCTSIAVISRYALYIAHFWDIPAFRVPAEDEDVPFKHVEENFRKDVLEYLQNTLDVPEFTNSNSEFPEPSPRAIMIAPQRSHGGIRRYKYDKNEDMLKDINKQIKNVLGNAEDINRAGYLVPHPHQKEKNIENGYRHETGKVLVMYDPNNNNAADNCKMRAAAIWSGDESTERRDPVYSTEWARPTATKGFEALPSIRGTKDKEGNLFKKRGLEIESY